MVSPIRRGSNGIEVKAGADSSVQAQLVPQRLPAAFGDWISADLHVHMNYGGHYRNTPDNLARQARAEDLDVVFNTIVNKEERIPDIGYFRTDADPASNSDQSRSCRRRNTTPVSGATSDCCSSTTTTSLRIFPPIATPRSPARIRTTA